MHAIKDTVYGKISRYFSDSQLSHETLDQEPEARPYAKDGTSLSSILSYMLPSATFDWLRPNGVKSTASHSFKWRNQNSSQKDKPLDMHKECSDEYHNSNESFGSPVENVQPSSSTCTSSRCDVFEENVSQSTFETSMPSLIDESVFISPDLYLFFEAALPNIVKGCQWVLLYSTARHGISLHTLVRKSADLTGPCLLITGDRQGAIFGGLLDCPLRPTAKRRYQGTNQSFVFTTIYGEPRLFRPTGANRYYYLCLNDLLALGGGGRFALCLNEDLLCGTSGPCETFGNMCLAHDQEFELKNVELWGFTHASQYLH